MFKRYTRSGGHRADEPQDRVKSRGQVRQQTKDFLLQLIKFIQDFRQRYPTDLQLDIDKALSNLNSAGHTLFFRFGMGESRSRRGEQIRIVMQMVSAVDTSFRIQYAEFQSHWRRIFGLWTLLLGQLKAYCADEGITIFCVNRALYTPSPADQSLQYESHLGSPTATTRQTIGCSFVHPSGLKSTGNASQPTDTEHGHLPRPPSCNAESIEGSVNIPRSSRQTGVPPWTPV